MSTLEVIKKLNLKLNNILSNRQLGVCKKADSFIKKFDKWVVIKSVSGKDINDLIEYIFSEDRRLEESFQTQKHKKSSTIQKKLNLIIDSISEEDIIAFVQYVVNKKRDLYFKYIIQKALLEYDQSDKHPHINFNILPYEILQFSQLEQHETSIAKVNTFQCHNMTTALNQKFFDFVRQKLVGLPISNNVEAITYNGIPFVTGLTNISSNCFINSVFQSLVASKEIAEALLYAWKQFGKIITTRNRERNADIALKALEYFLKTIVEMFRGQATDETYSKRLVHLLATNHPSVFFRAEIGQHHDPAEFLEKLIDYLDITLMALSSLSENTDYAHSSSEIFSKKIKLKVSKTLRCHFNRDHAEISTQYMDFTIKPDSPVFMKNIDNIFNQTDYYTGEGTGTWCSICKAHRTMTTTYKIIELPDLLVINISRAMPNNNKKILNRVGIMYGLTFDQRYLDEDVLNENYHLSSIIYHKGEFVNSGHYVTLAKNYTTNEWHLFDDKSVSPVVNLFEFLNEPDYMRKDLATPVMIFFTKEITSSSLVSQNTITEDLNLGFLEHNDCRFP
jgi:ubiquitin C-terminal hydrolase